MSTTPTHSRPHRSHLPDEPAHFPQRFFLKVKNDILALNGPGALEYEDIEPEIGSLVAISLDCDKEIEERSVYINFNSVSKEFRVTMPNEIHQCPLQWMISEFKHAFRSGFFNDQDDDELLLNAATRFDSFSPPYAQSFQEPDVYIKPETYPLPTIVFEVSYSQSYPRLISNKDLWLVGAAAHVNVVLLIKWSAIAQSPLKGRIEVWRKNNPTPEIFPIFPRDPPGNPPQEVSLSLGELYGNALPAGRNPGDLWRLSIDRLRRRSESAIRAEGFVPA